MKPEHMTTSRTAYKIDAAHPGSDLAGETAAAMAAAAVVFRGSDPEYSALLVAHARQLFTFADTHRGAYDSSIPIARSYYRSWSGYHDELLWAALWLFDATNETQYLSYVVENADTLGGAGWALDLFSWDNKYVGVQLKATKVPTAQPLPTIRVKV
jgi:endoglucanase